MRDSAVHYRKGAHVKTPQGKKIGTIDRVVFDPEAKKITHLVVRKGVLLSQDRVIPIDLIGPTEDGVQLVTGADPDEFPAFERTDFEIDSTSNFYVANPHLATGGFGLVSDPTVGQIRRGRNIPDDAIALKEGSSAIASDGTKVGKVVEVIADTEHDRAVQMVIATGVTGRDQIVVPTSIVISITEDKVHLGLDADAIREISTTG